MEAPTFDDISKVWIEPFSVIINCLFPVEWIYGDWYWWLADAEMKRSNPECIAFSSPTALEAGSRVEGFCIPRFFASKSNDAAFNLAEQNYWQPDLDKMTVNDHLVKCQTGAVIPIFTVEHADDDPRYVKLRLTEEWKEYHTRYAKVSFLHHTYLLPLQSTAMFAELEKEMYTSKDIHGPVRKLYKEGIPGSEEDDAQVFKYPTAWPEPAMEWLVRPRPSGWPSPDLVQEIFENGCHLAPVGRGKRKGEPISFIDYHRKPESADTAEATENRDNDQGEESMDETEWRVSFSMAENLLGQSVSPVQRHILVLLKMIKKLYFPEVICSYHFKNLLFWECETMEESLWREETSAKCLLHMLDRLQECLEQRCLPQYIMPQSNLLQYEDPVKLNEAAAAVADVRRNIVQRTVSLLKRLTSLGQLSNFYLQGLDLDLEQIQHCAIAKKEMKELLKSLYSVFVSKCKEMFGIIYGEQNPDVQTAILIPFYAYQSLMARILSKMWLLDSQCNSTEEEFAAFVRDEAKDQELGEQFVEIACQFYAQAKHKKEPSLLIPETSLMKRTNDIQREITFKTADECLGPMMQSIEHLKRSELDSLTKKISDTFQGKLDTITMADIEEALNEEIKELLKKAQKATDEK